MFSTLYLLTFIAFVIYFANAMILRETEKETARVTDRGKQGQKDRGQRQTDRWIARDREEGDRQTTKRFVGERVPVFRIHWSL